MARTANGPIGWIIGNIHVSVPMNQVRRHVVSKVSNYRQLTRAQRRKLLSDIYRLRMDDLHLYSTVTRGMF